MIKLIYYVIMQNKKYIKIGNLNNDEVFNYYDIINKIMEVK